MAMSDALYSVLGDLTNAVTIASDIAAVRKW